MLLNHRGGGGILCAVNRLMRGETLRGGLPAIIALGAADRLAAMAATGMARPNRIPLLFATRCDALSFFAFNPCKTLKIQAT